MSVPDVTVIVPVYNTMPYLTECLDSLVGQSLGHDRLHVVTVDDGSTDGSGSELDRYAERYPGLFTVVHQANSGGPAAPCNRGLELATGRFVFFLGSDDYLAERALEKLVDKADEWGSDVMIGRMVGVGGRYVNQELFQNDQQDLAFPHSRLPFAMSNTKLFRRSVLEEHGIRYPLDLRIGSDQPFTIEAMLRARRISVLADEPYYYAVRRHDAANISFSSSWRSIVDDIGNVMAHVAGLLPPGEDRDAVLHRHFSWEITKQLGPAFLDLEPDAQVELVTAVGRLADAYLTEGVSRRLAVDKRLRIRLAQSRQVAELSRVIDFLEAGEEPVLALGPDLPSLAYPGFGELPAEWFATSAASVRDRARQAVRLTRVSWEGTSLVVAAESDLHPVSAGSVRVALVRVRRARGVRPQRRFPRGTELEGRTWPVTLAAVAPPQNGSTLTARVDLAGLLGEGPGQGPGQGLGDGLGPQGSRWALRFHLDVGEHTYDLPAAGVPRAVTRVRTGLRFFRLAARRDEAGRMFVLRRRVPLRTVLRVEARRRFSRSRRPGPPG